MAPLLPLLLLLPPALLLLAAADPFPASCSTQATCAGVEIHYPFWLNSSGSESCGYPGLGLACEDSNTSLILSVQSHRYRVIDIHYDMHTVAVSNADAGDDEYGSDCPRLHWNLTIDYRSTWLQLAPSDSNMTFLYNCTKNISTAVELTGCGGGGYGNKRSYVLPDGVTNTTHEVYECEVVVVAPVLSDHKKEMIGGTPGPVGLPLENGSRYGAVVKAGFEFVYNPNSERCSRCESSGGWCGYRRNHTDDGESGFICYCDDGQSPISDYCSRSTPTCLPP